jgi:hypothetical protein
VINNESGWYEGWMIHDLTSARRGAASRRASTIRTMTYADAVAIAAGATITTSLENSSRATAKMTPFPRMSDHFPDRRRSRVRSIEHGRVQLPAAERLSCLLEFNEYTTGFFPLFEIPSTGGWQEHLRPASNTTFVVDTRIGPARRRQQPARPQADVGDDPNNPRDPIADRRRAPMTRNRPTTNDESEETRLRSSERPRQGNYCSMCSSG